MLHFLDLIHLRSLYIRKKSFHWHQWKTDLPSCKLLTASIYVIHLATGRILIYSIVAWITLIPTNSSPGSQNEMREYLPLQLCQPNIQLSTSSLPPRSHCHPKFRVYKSLIVTSVGLWLDSAGHWAFSGFSFPLKFLFLSSLCVCVCAGSHHAEIYHSWKITLWQLPQGKMLQQVNMSLFKQSSPYLHNQNNKL